MFKQWRAAIILSALAMLTVFMVACGADTGGTETPTPTATTGGSKVACESGTLKTGGSTALEPLVKELASKYKGECKDANISVGLGGSGAGLKGAVDGTFEVGNSDIFADESKYPGLTDNQVAAVVFAVVINEKVTGVESLTIDQLKGIYSGKITNWKEVGGPDLAIVTISRSSSSGTRITFEQFVLGQKESVSGSTHIQASSSGEVATKVPQTAGAIAYDTVFFAKNKNLKVVKIDNVEATEANAINDSYKFWGIEHMYTKGEAKGLAKAFIEYVKSDAAAPVVAEKGFIAISKITPEAIKAKTPSK